MEKIIEQDHCDNAEETCRYIDEMGSQKPGAKSHAKAREIESLADLSEGDLSNSGISGSESGSESESGSDGDINENENLREGEEDDEDENESESENEDEDEDEDKSDRPLKKARTGISAEEIQIARETSELFKSNIFKMQIDELLKEVALEEKYVSSVNHVLFKLNNILKDGKAVKDLSLKDAEKAVGKIIIPFAEPKPRDIKYTFSWSSPTEINVIGSYSLKTAIRQPEGVGIDLLVMMPSHLFQDKDYLNFRYFHKKAFYVAYLAQILAQANSDLFSVQYAFQADDPLKPMLQLKLTSSKLSKRFHINIMVGAPLETFDVKKLNVDRNCIRLSGDHSVATTLYNSSLVSDLTYSRFLKKLHTTSMKCAGFNEACKLGRLWLRQRGFSSAPKQGGFGNFEFALTMAILLDGGPTGSRVLANGYSSYQLFRGTINFLGTHDLSSNHGSLSFDGSRTTRLSAVSNEFVNNEGFPLVYDRISKLNILYKMSRWAYSLLKHEAAITCDLLNDVVKDRFDQIFLQPLKNHFRFDISFSVVVPTDDKAYSGLTKIQYLSPVRFWVNRLYRMLHRGFGTRVRKIAFVDLPSSTESGPITKAPASLTRSSRLELTIGLVLNPDECDKVLTFGPSAEDDRAVQKFQAFWGRKSELRRFQDGSIREVVPWESPYQGSNTPVVLQITNYLLNLHMPEVRLKARQASTNITASVMSGALTAHQAKYSAFQKAASMIQELEGLPLRVRSIFPISTSLRYTSIDAPEPYNLQVDDGVGSGLITFESSNKWPDDSEALEKTKLAFLLQIAKKISEGGSYDALIGTEKDYIPGLEIGFMQLQTPDGFSFKLRISTDFDLVLLNRAVQENGKNEKLKETIEIYKQKYEDSVTHTRLIQTMALRFNFYAPSCRLLKKWFKEHMLIGLFSEEAIELLALKPFVDSGPYLPPSNAATALLRVLDCISTWDWRQSALILDVSNHASVDGTRSNRLTPLTGTETNLGFYQRSNDAFEKLRKDIDPALTLAPMAIYTETDGTGISWTKNIPRSEIGKVVAARITGLARSAMMMTSIDYSRIFTSSLDGYNLVIDLKKIGAESQSEKKYKNLHIQRHGQFVDQQQVIDDSIDVTRKFYQDLSVRFSHTLVLFLGTTKICGLWYRDILEPRNFKVNLAYSTIPIDSQKVELNKQAIACEIERIGGNLVEKITLH